MCYYGYMNKLMSILEKLIFDKFTGTIEINFNQGGIRGVKKIEKKSL